MNNYHIPVMPKETISYLNVKSGSWYVDCTLGGGGHTKEILALGGKVLGIDLDPEALAEVGKVHHIDIGQKTDNLILYQSNFADLKNVVNKFNLGPVAGILLDLGVSSHQLETAKRGFSFNVDAPLDMRMSPNLQVTAADLINALHEKELAELFQKFGEENFAKPIARKIVEERQKQLIKTTDQLAKIILSIRRRSESDRTHPATRVFQALRIAVNDELNSLKTVLPQILDVLAPGGRVVIISFHSLEDRIVKEFFKNEHKNRTLTIITQKPITPTKQEVDFNPRSRSGKLRAAEKL
ncbi:16S rRNA (cytosine(1402)-N(4))-methyltransferase RsmH [Candidatus Daviesbacteria bacterium]|nr:16S rRNA (cytosine(1402)-N(4))-methyltransferase RsmH [Candidatus Daviesbacteria bacterium]